MLTAPAMRQVRFTEFNFRGSRLLATHSAFSLLSVSFRSWLVTPAYVRLLSSHCRKPALRARFWCGIPLANGFESVSRSTLDLLVSETITLVDELLVGIIFTGCAMATECDHLPLLIIHG